MKIEDALIIVNRFSRGLEVEETKLREALPVVIVYAEMMLKQENNEDKMKVFEVTHTASGGYKTSQVVTTDKKYVQGLLNEHYGEDVLITNIEDPYPPLATRPQEGVL